MPFLAFRYRCPVRSFRSHLRDNRPFVRLAVLISEFPIIRKKIHLMLFLKKEIRHRSAKISRQSKLTFSHSEEKPFYEQNKVNPEDDNPQPTLPATIKESHAPLRWSRLFLPTTCATMDRRRQNKKLSNTSDFNAFRPCRINSDMGNFQFRGFGRQLRHSRNYCSKPLCRKLYSPPRAIIR